MAIQGTQVPMYTKHTLFLYFSDFSIFFFNKINKTEKQPNKNKLNKTKHKTRLTQKVKQNTQEMQSKTRRREESNRITWSHFPSTP